MKDNEVLPEDRLSVFEEKALLVISQYGIHSSSNYTHLDSQRIGHLFSTLIVIIYREGRIGQDADICFRDWAWKNKLVCSEIKEMEYHKKIKFKNPYPYKTTRLYERLNFKKYTDLLENIFSPRRQPLVGRFPKTRLLGVQNVRRRIRLCL